MKFQTLILLALAAAGVFFGQDRFSAQENAKPILAGGWMIHEKIDADMTEYLTIAVEQINKQPGRVSTVYTPAAASTQVVAGLNFCFLCIAEPEKGIPYFCRITFYAPPGAEKTVESVVETPIPFRPEAEGL